MKSIQIEGKTEASDSIQNLKPNIYVSLKFKNKIHSRNLVVAFLQNTFTLWLLSLRKQQKESTINYSSFITLPQLFIA